MPALCPPDCLPRVTLLPNDCSSHRRRMPAPHSPVRRPRSVCAWSKPPPLCHRQPLLTCRRPLLALLLPWLPLTCHADVSAPPAWAPLSVVVSLSPGVQPPASEAAALYVTLRPPGRSPPLAARRVPLAGAAFPLRLELTAEDALPDAPPAEAWRDARELLVSARLDTDGVAATRDPDDLVGRGAAQRLDGIWSPAQLQLVGRGLAGKLATQKAR